MKAMPKRRSVQVVGTIVSLGLLAILLLGQDWEELLRLTASIPLWVFAVGLGLLGLRAFMYAMRWLALLRAQSVNLSIREAVRLQWAGLFAGNFLPTNVGGDVVRLYGIIPASPSKVIAAASIAVDRAMGAIGMLFFLPFSIPLLNMIFPLAAGTQAADRLRPLDRVRASFDRLKEALALWASKPMSLLFALVATWVGILSFMIMIWLLAQALDIPIDFYDVLGAGALNYYVALIPFSINSYGIRELGLTFFYTQLGASSEQALTLAILSRALLLLVSLPGAIILPGALASRPEAGPIESGE